MAGIAQATLVDAIAAVASGRRVLFHPGFPVDIRHNAKIGRETLAVWAATRVG